MKKILTIFISLALASILLVACNSANDSAEEFDGDIKDLVHEYSVGNIEDAEAWITSNELIVTTHDGEEIIYELPEDEFFVSFAPYLKDTHP